MFLLGILVLISLGKAKYIETPTHVFKVFDDATSMVDRIYLSPDSDQLMLFTKDLSNQSHVSQSIFYFNGTKACFMPYTYSSYSFQGWILGTKGLIKQYDDSSKKTIFRKQEDICSEPVDIFTFQQNIRRYDIRNTSQSTYITILFQNSKVSQYDLNTGNFCLLDLGQLFRNFTLSDTQQVWSVIYSPDQKYIYTRIGFDNIVIFDANTLQKVKQMKNGDTLAYALIYGFNDGKSFLGLYPWTMGIYYIDEQTNKFIYSINRNKKYEDIAAICGMNHTLAIVTQSRTGQRLITYDTRNGDVIQNFSINLNGKFNRSDCNNNYLSLIDANGYAYIFTYNHTQPQPEPDPKPDPKPQPEPDNNKNLLTILQIVGSIAVIQTIIIVIISVCICRKIRERNKLRQQQRMHLLEDQDNRIN